VGEKIVRHTIDDICDVHNVCNVLNSPRSTRTPLLASPCGIPGILLPISAAGVGLVAPKASQPGADDELFIQHTCWMISFARGHYSLSWWPRGHRFGALLWRILDLQSPALITLASAPPPLRPSKEAIERRLVGNPERFYRHQLDLSRMPSDMLGASKLISIKERKRVKSSRFRAKRERGPAETSENGQKN
jgi:hypothetical protein